MKVVEIEIDVRDIGRDLRLTVDNEFYEGYPRENTAGYILSMQTETGFSCGLVGPDEQGRYNIKINEYMPGSTTEFSTHVPYNINFSRATATPPDSPTVYSLGNGHVHPNICYNLYGCILGLPSTGDLINAVDMYMKHGLPFTLVIAREGLYVITFKEEHALELGIGTPGALAAHRNYESYINSQVTRSGFYANIFTFYQFLLQKERNENLVQVRFIAHRNYRDTRDPQEYEYNCDQWKEITGGNLNIYKTMTVRVRIPSSRSYEDVDYSSEPIDSNFDNSFEQVMDHIEQALGTETMKRYIQEHINNYLEVYYRSFINHEQSQATDFVHVALIKWKINSADRLLPYYKDYLNLKSFRDGGAQNMSIVDNYPLNGNSGQTPSNQRRGVHASLPNRVFSNR